MKEDYLWDKTGEPDAEIEQLENVLSALRYRETAPPKLPLPNVLPFKNNSVEPRGLRRRPWRFAPAAAAACLLFGVLALGAWLQILRSNMEAGPAERAATTQQQPPQEAGGRKEEFKQVADGGGGGGRQTAADNSNVRPPVKKLAKPKPSVLRTVYRVRKPAAAAARNHLVAQRKIKQPSAARPEVYLTEEERYAYNQLMLALSITSSKLKIVKDKVEGLDEKKVFVRTENN